MSYSYIRGVPSVSTYNGVGSYGIDFPMPGFIEELLGDREDVAGEGGPPPIDLTPPPVYCDRGKAALPRSTLPRHRCVAPTALRRP